VLKEPTVLGRGAGLSPGARGGPSWCWPETAEPFAGHADLAGERYSSVYVTRDQGETFELLGRADVPERVFDEHMIVERRDGSLRMLVRTLHGIGESVSTDRGRTWSPGRDSGLGGPCSRFFIRRLQSGRLLLINHYEFTGRNNLTALLSDDDGATWPHHLLLDARAEVSYPDGIQAPDGTIHIIYDRERHGAREILLASFTEDDVLAGKPVTAACSLERLVNNIR